MKYWPDRSSSATQFAFLHDPEGGSSDSMRSSAVLIEKERERRKNDARAPLMFIMSYPHPRQPTVRFLIPTRANGQA
jgi:hypothetical protein